MLQHRPRAPIVPWLRTLSVALLAIVALPRASPRGRPRLDARHARAASARQAAASTGSHAIRHGELQLRGRGLRHGLDRPQELRSRRLVPRRWRGRCVGLRHRMRRGRTRRRVGTASSDRYFLRSSRAVNLRPEWYYDYGNQVNEGNTNLWAARDLAGRKYVKTGVAGVWHSDDMTGVKLNIADGAEPTSVPISGTRSAWCGLRESGNTKAKDALTGNYINGDLYADVGPIVHGQRQHARVPGLLRPVGPDAVQGLRLDGQRLGGVEAARRREPEARHGDERLGLVQPRSDEVRATTSTSRRTR